MTQLQDDMKNTIAALQANHGITADQATTIANSAVAPILASLNNTINSQKSDEETLADVKATLQELNAAFAPVQPTSTSDAAPTSAPDTAPTPAPAPAPDATPTTSQAATGPTPATTPAA